MFLSDRINLVDRVKEPDQGMAAMIGLEKGKEKGEKESGIDNLPYLYCGFDKISIHCN